MVKTAKTDIADLISISEAARLRGVSHAAIQDLLMRGKLSAVEVAGRRLLSRAEVASFQPEPVGSPGKHATERTQRLNRAFRQAVEAEGKKGKAKRRRA
jgi:excisionase family DNA binding protein